MVSGLLNLSRNLGLITGASVMGGVFALGAATTDSVSARPDALVSGLRLVFAVATGLTSLALAIGFTLVRRRS